VSRLLCFTLVASLPLAGRAADLAPVSVAVSPAAIDIRHHRQPFAIQVLGQSADGYSIDLAPGATFTPADPKVVRIDGKGLVVPLTSGQTKVTVAAGGKSFDVAVTVALPAAEPPTSFRHEVMPVLSKAGCNAGACHGYSLGKNGFKLSLRGADADADFANIRHEFAARRVNFHSPASSLLLTKSRGEVPHDGGARFSRDSLMSKILSRWVEDACPSDLADKGEVVAVRVTPATLALRPGDRHKLRLVAEYTDGRQRDVTALAIFSANNDRFASVDDIDFQALRIGDSRATDQDQQ